MTNSKQLDRRKFMKLSGVALTGVPFLPLMAKQTSTSELEKPICIFSEHFQWLEYGEMGKLMNEVGFDGINITVRNGGHVAPYDVERKLPEALYKIRKYGIEVPMITTDILNAEDSLTEPVLKTASELGVKYYRMGHYRYDRNVPVVDQLEKIKEKMLRLAELNEKYQIKGNYQNFSGVEVGSSIWDIWYIIKDITSDWIGIQFDLRNAIVEGGKSWENDLVVVKDMIQSTVVRDFNWATGAKNTNYAKGVKLGEGIVDFPKYFQIFKKLNVEGPITVYLDFPFTNDENDQLLKSEKINSARVALAMELRNLKNYLSSEGIR